MRCDLAAALLHEPQLLFLDEPTIGLDVVAKENVRAFLKEANRSGRTTVILTTHDLDDIEELCPRVILIDGGRILYDGDLEQLKERHGAFDVMTVSTDAELDEEIAGRLGALPGRSGSARGRYQIEYPRAQATPMEVLQQIGATPRSPISPSGPPRSRRPSPASTGAGVSRGRRLKEA